MANYYVKSGAAGAADGSSWANAFTTLAAAFSGKSAGDVFWVSDNHAETQASAMTLTSPGTDASPCQVLCVDDSASPPTATATTATISTTGANAITMNGFAYVYGITFNCSDGATAATFGLGTSGTAIRWVFDSCKLAILGTGGSAVIRFGNSTGAVAEESFVLINTDIEIGNAAHNLQLNAPLEWRGGAVEGATVPTYLLTINTGSRRGTITNIVGADLSLLDSGENLINAASAAGYSVVFENCKLGSSVAVVTGNIPSHSTIDLVNCDSADTNYRYAKHRYEGTITQETTIVRTGGSTDGTTSFSRKFVTTANSKFYSPLEGPWFRFWNETVGSVTVTIEVVTDNVTLTNAEAWVEVEYQGTSGFPLALFANDRAADILATPANQTSSSETWTTTGLGTPVKQALAVTFTTAEKGWVMARAVLAKASTTMYACAKILSTSYKQTMEADGSILNDVDIPAVGEVQTGVQYGADGTERTGTLAGGSGGLLTHPGMNGGLRG